MLEIAEVIFQEGVDILELGLPFSDPIADGMTIQTTTHQALARGIRLTQTFAMAQRLRDTGLGPLVLMSYLNPIHRMGLSSFFRKARRSGFSGVLLADLPVDEAGDALRKAGSHGISLALFAAPTTSSNRLKRIADLSQGFIYAVSLTGTTGERKDLAPDALPLLARLRRITRKPVVVGFGISQPCHVSSVRSFCDGVIVGSALLKTIQESPGQEARAAGQLICKLRGALDA